MLTDFSKAKLLVIAAFVFVLTSCGDSAHLMQGDLAGYIDDPGVTDPADEIAGEAQQSEAEAVTCSISTVANNLVVTCTDGTVVEVKDGVDGVDGADGSDGADGVDGSDGVDGDSCHLYQAVDGYVVACVDDDIFIDVVNAESRDLAAASSDGSTITLVASMKNGGIGGSMWFNSDYETGGALDLDLPDSISADGEAGDGKILYVLFNGMIDCAWYSSADVEYKDPRCFINAARDAGEASGFTGGVEVAATAVFDVLTIEMEILGSSGDGVVTTATAEFDIR